MKDGPETLLTQRPALTTMRRTRTMAKPTLPDADYLRKLFEYDQEAGSLTYRMRDRALFASDYHWKRWNSMFAGRRALNSVHAVGYRYGAIDGRSYYAHRVIWKIVHGADPQTIDHINGDKIDNRLCNLRSVEEVYNHRNLKLRAGSTSGVLGVGFYKNRWVATIRGDGRNPYLGRFADLSEAIKARKAAEAEHGYHPNHGRD